jgi:ABC-type Fe3+/spermidine/putrescine transport system ATPase subunit
LDSADSNPFSGHSRYGSGNGQQITSEEGDKTQLATGNDSSPSFSSKAWSSDSANVVAVEKMDLDIEEGSLVTLLGPPDAEKPPCCAWWPGWKPTEGDIYIKGKRINDTPIHKRNLGMIFQNYALFPHKTIFDNVAFGLKYRDIPRGSSRTR